MKGQKPAPVLAFVNMKPRPPQSVVVPPAPRLADKMQRLADEYPQALVEVELLVDDYLAALDRGSRI